MRVTLFIIASVLMLLPGCAKKSRIAAKLPAPSQGALTKPAPVLSLPPTIATIETPVAPPPVKAEEEEEPTPAPDVATPSAPKKPVTRRPSKPVAPLAGATTPDPAPAAPETGPQLRELLTPELRLQYEKDLSKSVAEARSALNRASRIKHLTPVQRENVSRIQTFLTQAQASRKDDLGTSLQLARRAALLGQELMKSLLP